LDARPYPHGGITPITRSGVEASLSKIFRNFAHPDDRSELGREQTALIAGARSHAQLEARYVNPNGSTRWIAIQSCLLRGQARDVHGTTGILRDVTEQREAQQRMVHLAHHDALTDLPNPILARERLQRLLHAAQGDSSGSVALLFIVIDDFVATLSPSPAMLGRSRRPKRPMTQTRLQLPRRPRIARWMRLHCPPVAHLDRSDS